MKGATLEIEIKIAPATGRYGGRRRSAEPEAPEPTRIPRVARLMALAIKLQDMVDRGEVRDYADLARLGFVTRARLTQIMNLQLLAPDIQADLLGVGPQAAAIPERDVREIVKLVMWDEQRAMWAVRARLTCAGGGQASRARRRGTTPSAE